jgi:hypothetical protein
MYGLILDYQLTIEEAIVAYYCVLIDAESDRGNTPIDTPKNHNQKYIILATGPNDVHALYTLIDFEFDSEHARGSGFA